VRSSTPNRRKKLLADTEGAAARITGFVEGKGFEEYAGDGLLQSAVERQFLIIGEAMRQLLRLDPDVAGRITHARRAIGFRDRLVHGHDLVDDEVVWDVIETHLPTLRRQVRVLLAEE
jgi:uncharacterized protein with HEPN domain